MATYEVTLFGNRRGAALGKDYGCGVFPTYRQARECLERNNKWGNIKEHRSKAEALESARQFRWEILESCLSFASVNLGEQHNA